MNRRRIVMVSGNNQLRMLSLASVRFPDLECRGINNLRRTHDEIRTELERIDGASLVIVNASMPAETVSIADDLKGFSSSNAVVFVSRDRSAEGLSTAREDIVEAVHSYISNSGIENYARMLEYISSGARRDPVGIPQQGLIDPAEPEKVFGSWEDYISAHPPDGRPTAALLAGRESWLAGRRSTDMCLVHSLESEGVRTVVMISRPKYDREAGSLNSSGAVYALLTDHGTSHVDAVVSPGSSSFEDVLDADGRRVMSWTELASKMDVPMVNPLVLSGMNEKEWLEKDGLGSKLSSYIVLPEYSGLTDPFMIATSERRGEDSEECPLEGRCRRFAHRLRKRIDLQRKRNSEKRIVFMLNISACASVEATIGLAVSLDTFESLRRIMSEMKERGYDVRVPESADSIVRDILDRKAFAAHRWASPEDISSAGGVVYRMPAAEYAGMFSRLPEKVRTDMESVWGEAPGNGMVVDGNILITGVEYGNAVVAVEPKRGCDQPRCDGEVCKMIYNRSCPPSHCYLATYLYYTRIWDADAIVHVGTHGTMEHLPGKSVALSDSCYPDICIGDTPLMYIFRVADSTNGSIAKRRGYATLIDHMLPARASAPAGAFAGPEGLLRRYDGDPSSRPEVLKEIEKVLSEADPRNLPEDEGLLVSRARELLSAARMTTVEKGSHIFGDVPRGSDLASMVSTVLRGSDPSLADADSATLEKAVSDALRGGGASAFADITGCDPEYLERRTARLAEQISSSDEMGALMNALDGGYTPPGPAGTVSGGDGSAFPTGRNFYCLDPYALPTRKAWSVGMGLADSAVQRYIEDQGSYPESIAVAWIVSDLSLFSGEVMAQILALIGARPVWGRNGRVASFEIVPLDELGRPRIDVMVRISPSVKLYYRNCIDLVDDAVNAVSLLDEPNDMNLVRKHTLESMADGVPADAASSRIFGSAPGGNSGMFYAIASGAWKDRSDLAGIYISNTGYAYGRGKDGVPMHGQFAYGLSKVSMTFNRIASDEKDLMSSGSYFISQGGMSLAAEAVTGKRPASYFGDTRANGRVGIRTLREEIGRIADAKYLNPEWADGVRKGGYKAAGELSDAVLGLFGWQASSGEVDRRIFDGIAETYVLDPEMRRALKESNLYAMDLIVKRLLEAAGRGLWDADKDTVDELKDVYLELEGDMEGISDSGDVQGNEIRMGLEPRDAAWEHAKDERLKAAKMRMGMHGTRRSP